MTEGRTAPRFFLGANSSRGFVSLYDTWLPPDSGEFLRVIKGGPGCGKSSLMRRIGAAAEAAGLETEYILCSGDPDSLDGVRLPGRKAAYTDGTAPHVQEPVCPGAAGAYLDLGQYLRQEALRPLAGELEALTKAYRAQYDAAYRRLGAAAALLPKNIPGLLSPAAEAKLRQRAAALAAREFGACPGNGGLSKRFLSAVSAGGRVRLHGTVGALCDRLWLLDNTCGGGHLFLSALEAEAAARGCGRILCLDPLEPEKPEALFLPGLRLGFLADDGGWDAGLLPVYRHLRTDAALALPTSLRGELRQRRRESALLLRGAEASLQSAKALHDALEAMYRPHVDFSGADAVLREQLRLLGLEKKSVPGAGYAEQKKKNGAATDASASISTPFLVREAGVEPARPE